MLNLVKMTQTEFPGYIDQVETNYAEELYSNHYMTLEAARERSRKQTREALAQGVETPGHLLFTVRDQETQQRVGILWIGIFSEQNEAWIYDIEIDAAYRGRGYGRETMLLLEEELRERGIPRVGLNVFGRNAVARHLYESVGYQVSSIQMSKDIA
jgi:ribosomal protein S18 acetylase RimI-like enzyme